MWWDKELERYMQQQGYGGETIEQIQKKIREKDKLLFRQIDYMKTCEERRPDYRILFEIYTERIYMAIRNRDVKFLRKTFKKLKSLQRERRRMYFQQVYKDYVQKKGEETYVNIYLKRDWRGEYFEEGYLGEEYIKVSIEYAPYKIQEVDMQYIIRPFNMPCDEESEDDETEDLNAYYDDEQKKKQCVLESIIKQIKSEDIETLKWWYDFSYKNIQYQQIYKWMKFKLIDQVSKIENIECLDILQKNFRFSYSNRDSSRGSNRILYYHMVGIDSLTYDEEGKKKGIYKWWRQFFSQDKDRESQEEVRKDLNREWRDQEEQERMRRELQECGWLK